jgi:hypothetical protein
LIIFTAVNCDAGIHREVYGSVISRATVFLIVLWLLITGGLIILSDLSVRQTKRGYIYPLWLIFVIDVVLSVIFGVIFYAIGIGGYMDMELSRYADFYDNVEKRRAALFNKPENGILIGRVVHAADGHVKIATANNDMWVVFTNELQGTQAATLQEGVDVVFAGVKREDGTFVACDTRVVGLHGMHQKMYEQHMQAFMQAFKEHQKVLEEKLLNPPQKIYCTNGVSWRIQIQH